MFSKLKLMLKEAQTLEVQVGNHDMNSLLIHTSSEMSHFLWEFHWETLRAMHQSKICKDLIYKVCKSNPCHPLHYKRDSLIFVFISIKAMQDKIALEIVSINKSNVRIKQKYQIPSKTSVIFCTFMYQSESCWNEMFSLRARKFAVCFKCRLHRVCPTYSCLTKPPSCDYSATRDEWGIVYHHH